MSPATLLLSDKTKGRLEASNYVVSLSFIGGGWVAHSSVTHFLIDPSWIERVRRRRRSDPASGEG
jgi:hypothetical protein